MIIRTNPNRMELLRLRKRLILARRGHKLLQDKLEEMMRRFLLLLKEIDQAKQYFVLRTSNMSMDLLHCRLTHSRDEFIQSLSGIEVHIALNVSSNKIMNVRVPIIDIAELKIEKQYDFFKTSAQLDIVIAEAKQYVNSLMRMAQLLKSLLILSAEIERTRRRVNALQYILIPSIEKTIRYITQKLNEFERGNLVRLMCVKEIVRSH